MSSNKRQVPSGKLKRQEFKEMRRKRQQRQRIAIVAIVVLGALALITAIALPSIQTAIAPHTVTAPVGQIKEITPVARSQASGTSAGNPSAPVKVDVWEDFQCPACMQYTQYTESRIMEDYVARGAVYYSFHQFPFIDDRAVTHESDQAANASMCAAKQDRFWDYHDMLFANWNGENDGSFNDMRLTAFAEKLALNMNDFKSCFSDNQFKDQINQDLENGRKLGVTSTPSIFVNGQMVKASAGEGYVPSFDDIKTYIDMALGGVQN